MKNITIKGNKFVDRENREVILRGINMVCKDKDKNFLGRYTDEDFQLLKSLGFNVVRLGIFWKAVEPSPGKYDYGYLSEIENYISVAAKYDINIFVDMHQDLFADKFSDGAPDWAIINELEHVETGLWSESYLLSPAVQCAFDDFFSNKKLDTGIGLLDYYKDMWKAVMAVMAKHDNVIGYDFINEPFMGSSVNELLGTLLHTLGEVVDEEMSFEELQGIWLDPSQKMTLMSILDDKTKFEKLVRNSQHVSQRFESEILQPFYDEMTQIARTIDENAIIFLETNYFSNMGMKSGIKRTEGDKYQCYAPHGYDLLVDTEGYEITNNDRVELIFKTHESVAIENNLPMLVGEWGCFPNATDNQVDHAKAIVAMFEQMLASDTYFDYDHLVNNKIIEALHRGYPLAIAGSVDNYHYDYDNQVFSINISKYRVGTPSKIFLPRSEVIDVNITDLDYSISAVDNSDSCVFTFSPSTENIELVIKIS